MSTNKPLSNREAFEERRRQQKKRGRRIISIIVLLCFALLMGTGAAAFRTWTVPLDKNSKEQITVDIPTGTPVNQIGAILQEKGVIRSGLGFKLYVKIRGIGPELQAGSHVLSPSMSIEKVANALKENAGQIGIRRIQVKEGMTISQIADVVAEQTDYSREDFIDLMEDSAWIQSLTEDYPFLEETAQSDEVRYALEGYLFPATYEFNDSDKLEVLVKMMLDKTKKVLDSYAQEIENSGHSINEIMSLASLIEKEGVTTEDRKKIAGVFYNRLEQGMPIQSDISVLYAMDTHKEYVSLADLQTESPYNLYLNKGLPPGPMNSPGEDAIVAAIEPDDNDYIYFIADLKTGKIFYTADYEQHLAWQKEYEENGRIEG